MKQIKQIDIKELFHFLVSGGTAVLIDFLLYKLLLQQGIYINISKGISFIAGAFAGFILNKFWTFNCPKFSKREILRYIILYAITGITNVYVNRIALNLSSIQVFSYLCATAVSTVLNFFGQKYIVFNKRGVKK